MEQQFSALAPFGLSETLTLGDVRPKWAAMQPWWDLHCDRDLLLGTYLHGFGAYAKMRVDPRLCFSSKARGFIPLLLSLRIHLSFPDWEGIGIMEREPL